MLGIRLPAGRATALAERLAETGVHVEILGSVMRVSPHLHATDEDLGHLFAALDHLLEDHR
jgi:4-aminobutyrate aminotransferase-like enzyme